MGQQFLNASRQFSTKCDVILVFVVLLCAVTVDGRERPTANRLIHHSSTGSSQEAASRTCIAFQNIGDINVILDDNGAIGHWDYLLEWRIQYDCFTGDFNALEGGYPEATRVEYLWDYGLWLGGVVGNDTLVSTAFQHVDIGNELYGNLHQRGGFDYRSTLDPDDAAFEGAVSEQDFVTSYTDTFIGGPGVVLPLDYFNNRPHKPMGIEVAQTSYSWSYGYTRDFVLIDYRIRNIGEKEIRDAYLGLFYSVHVAYVSGVDGIPEIGSYDDIGGFLPAWPSSKDCGIDTIHAAWFADSDGDPVDGAWSRGIDPWRSCTSVQGFRFLNRPYGSSRLSFNWWYTDFFNPTIDFGPRRVPGPGNEFRDFRTGGLGVPNGDINRYYQLRNGEIDYDVFRIGSIQQGDTSWLYPPQAVAENLTDGGEVEYLFSIGPFSLEPGEAQTMVVAYVAGENFHRDPDNLQRLLNGRPDEYYARLDFSDFAKNAMWAQWVYDNPGVDTDNDGYAGDYRVCVIDSELVDGVWLPSVAETTYYRGDGVPDWRAAGPPPPPKVYLEKRLNGLRVRFNGHASETTKDIFTQIIDFEGYRIYFGRDARRESLSLLASYDIEDFDKYVFDPQLYPNGGYRIQSAPMSLQEIRCRYSRAPDPCNDLTFDPLAFSAANPYVNPALPDSAFYFTKHDANASLLGVATPITKVYPDQPLPQPGDTLDPEALTPEGNLKYYEYEFTIDNLLPTVPYYVNVTAFDFGSPESGLSVLESSPTLNIQSAYPASDIAQVTGEKLPVYVYPNPYRADGGYRPRGFEGRHDDNAIDDRVRKVHFENLPAKCTIRIFSLDGDLIREIRHDYEISDPNHSHDSWDLINRNMQAVVSGIYYWSVEEPDGRSQMGKLVIIK